MSGDPKPIGLSLAMQISAVKAELVLEMQRLEDLESGTIEWIAMEADMSRAELMSALRPDGVATLELLDKVASCVILDLRITLESPQDPEVRRRRVRG